MKLTHAALALALLGCGSTAVEPVTTNEPVAIAPAATEPIAEARVEVAGPSEEQARAAAESFVRAQGYADTAPSVTDDQIVHEGIEGSIASRRNMLDPHAVSVAPTEGGWSATFRYQDPQYAGRGRMLVHTAEGTHFVHQDLLLSPATN